MANSGARPGQALSGPSFDRILRRIGLKLRELYERPEAEPLPIEHVNLLLRLRQKERERSRSHAGA